MDCNSFLISKDGGGIDTLSSLEQPPDDYQPEDDDIEDKCSGFGYINK